MPLSSSILVLIIPLFMFLFLGIVGVKMGKKLTGWLGVLGMGVTAVICYGVAITYFFGGDPATIAADGTRKAILA